VSAIILVVDDNEDNVHIAREILLSRGFEVRVAYNGPSALVSVEQQRPDLILLDIMMPQMSGMDVLDRLRANPATANVPVILVTAKDQDEDLLAGYKYGADYYITKPFSAKQLLYGIGLVLAPSVVPEAFCLTISEAWAAGAAVAAFDVGAQGERIRRQGGGWVAPLESGAEGIVQIIDRWAPIPVPREIPLAEESARAYLDLYRRLGWLG